MVAPRESARPASVRSGADGVGGSRPSTQHSSSRPSTRGSAGGGMQRGRTETKREKAERVKAEARAEAERLAEEESIRKKAEEEKRRRIKELADDMARQREEKMEEGRQQRREALELKLCAIREQIIREDIVRREALQAAAEMEDEAREQASRMKSEVEAMEKVINEQVSAMKAPGWLQSAHAARRREAIAALAKLERGSLEQVAAAEAVDEMEETSAVGEGRDEVVWRGSDEEIAQAQQTIKILDQKVQRLIDRIQQAPFMSEATKAVVEGEVRKAKETTVRLQANIDRTMIKRKIARLHTLPARPSSSWINLQLLKKQHSTLLAHPKVLAVSSLNAQAAGWQKCIDPSTGYSYYFHPATNTTQWHPPEGLNKYRNHVLTASNEAAFFDSREKKLKAVLFTKRTETPALWLRMVESFGATCTFGEVRLSEAGLMERFGIDIDSLPRVVAIVGVEGTGNEQDQVLLIQYQGTTDFEHLSDFINETSRRALSPQPSEQMPGDNHRAQQPKDDSSLLNHRVRVKGLEDKDRFELNGLLGTAHSFDPTTGCYSVRLDCYTDKTFALSESNLEGRGLATEYNELYSRPSTSWSGIKDRVDVISAQDAKRPLLQRRIQTSGDFRRRVEKPTSPRERPSTTGASAGSDSGSHAHGAAERFVVDAEGVSHPEAGWPPSLPANRWQDRAEVMQNVNINPRVAASVFRHALLGRASNSKWAALKRQAGLEAGCPEAGGARIAPTEYILISNRPRARLMPAKPKRASWTSLVGVLRSQQDQFISYLSADL